MKYVKTFEAYESPAWQGHETESEEGDQFARIVPKRKIDKDFEIKAESIANLIINCPEYSRLKELALDITNFGPYEAGEGSPKEYFSELSKCFPNLDLKISQFVNTGTKIPFYGRAKNSAGGLVTGHSANIYLPLYIVKKIQQPGYKY